MHIDPHVSKKDQYKYDGDDTVAGFQHFQSGRYH